MRKSVLAFLLAFLLAASASTAAQAAPGNRGHGQQDGTLAVDGGRGAVVLNIKGAVLARVKKGTLKLKIVKSVDAQPVEVHGKRLKHRVTAGGFDVYSGKHLRIKVVDSRMRFHLTGNGIHLSAVGQGRVTLNGSNQTTDDGVYSVNDGDPQPIPQHPITFHLSYNGGHGQ